MKRDHWILLALLAIALAYVIVAVIIELAIRGGS